MRNRLHAGTRPGSTNLAASVAVAATIASTHTPTAAQLCEPDIIFGDEVRLPLEGAPVDLALGDLDGDGDLDIVVASNADHEVSVLLNDGNGHFPEHDRYQTAPQAFAPADVAIGDLDGDGHPDLAVQFVSGVSILFNDGDAKFDDLQFGVGGGILQGLALGDLNQDNMLDILVSDREAGRVVAWLNTGGGFQFRTIGVPFPDKVSLGPIDGNATLDFAVARGISHLVTVGWGVGDGTFSGWNEFPSTGSPEMIALGDLNGDGDTDLVAPNDANRIDVYFNNGDHTFELATYIVGGLPVSAASADLDGDGDLDVVVANSGSQDASIFINGCVDLPGIVQPASTLADAGSPFSLEVIVQSGTPPMHFQWFKDSVPLTDGGTLSGATTDTLTVSPASIADAARYTVEVSNAYGSVLSDPAVVAVRDDCIADMNDDGHLNSLDFFELIDAFAAGCP